MNKENTSAFLKDYADLAHLQTMLNEDAFAVLVPQIKEYFSERKRPLKILDLCCGHGGPTYRLLNLLQENNVEVEKISGCDISEEQIDNAKKSYGHIPKIELFVQDIEEIEARGFKEEFDFVVSFFGLHWIKDIAHLAKTIAKTIKPGGFIFFNVPLDDKFFFAQRQFCLKNSAEFHDLFAKENLIVAPFIFHEKIYGDTFSQMFLPKEAFLKTRYVNYTRELFILFLAGVLPEIRFLKRRNLDWRIYADYLVDNFIASNNEFLQQKDSDTVIFKVDTFHFMGQKQ